MQMTASYTHILHTHAHMQPSPHAANSLIANLCLCRAQNHATSHSLGQA